MKTYKLLVLALILASCQQDSNKREGIAKTRIYPNLASPSLVVLGNVQDAGSPHIACTKDCCKDLFENPNQNRKVVSLGLIDPQSRKKFLIEASPEMTSQMKVLKNYASFSNQESPDGILVTHAHIGHYTGLMFLGKEAMNAKKVPVYAMPRMKTFLEENGPWSQLVNTDNIVIQVLQDQETTQLSTNIQVQPYSVPHRDEYSETIGLTIIGPNKRVLFVPDIDKWDKWEVDIIEAIAKVDYAFIDGTFFDGDELGNRDMSTIPHPFVVESMQKFSQLSDAEKKKIYFTHLNHSNPLLRLDSPQTKLVLESGFNIARMHDIIKL